MWIVILSFLSLFSMQQNASSFLNFFKSQSIPVEDMRFQDESVILKLHYKDVIDFADDNMQHHVLTIVRKVAEEFKRSKNIIIEIFDTGELISELSFSALNAFAYAQGNIGDEEILSKMTVKEHITIEDMMASLIPEEAESEKPIKIINPPVLDPTKPNVAPNYEKVLEGNNRNKNMGPKILFMDDFNSENNGRGNLNYRSFENWEVSSGEVDLIGNGFWDFHPDYGLHLDLDGSGGKAGSLQSKTKFRLLPGVYTLEFDLAGNFQRTVNTVRVIMGDLYNEEFTLQAKEAFRKIKREINVSSVIETRLIFQHRGGDNFGLLLDNVRLIKTAGQESLKEVVIGDNLRKKPLSRDQEMLKTARQLLLNKDYDKAIGQFRKTIDSLHFQSFQGLGLCYYYKKYFDDAFYYFAKAYKENPRSPLTLFYMAATLDQWGKGLEAVFCFETYLKLNDSDKNRREIAQQRWQYLKRRSQRPGHSLYRSVDEVIYVILGDEINGGTPFLLCLNGCR